MLVRTKALEVALAEARRRVKESGSNNRGPRVDQYQKVDDVPGVGYAWCMAFVQWCYRQTGVPLGTRTAHVGTFLNWARRKGWEVKRPLRGDIVCFRFSSSWPTDHVGIVERVLRLGPILRIRTVEGNTGSAGSVSDPGTGRDGVYHKVRIVRRSSVAFVRVPGSLPPKRTVIKRQSLGGGLRRSL